MVSGRARAVPDQEDASGKVNHTVLPLSVGRVPQLSARTSTSSRPRPDSSPDSANRRWGRRALRSVTCGRPVQTAGDLTHPACPFSEHLIRVLRGISHDREDLPDEVQRHPRVEQIRHGVHEHRPWAAPPVRHPQSIRMNRQPETRPGRPCVPVVLVLRRPHRLEPFCQCQGVAVVASRRDPVAPRRRVPGRLGPLDRASVTHQLPPRRPTAPTGYGTACSTNHDRLRHSPSNHSSDINFSAIPELRKSSRATRRAVMPCDSVTA